MEYTVREDFVDIHDDSYFYRAGDKFPRPGVFVSDERIAELSSDRNRVGRMLIEAAERPIEAIQDEGKEIPDQTIKTARRGRRSRKRE
jgi:hypothetical protein